MNKQKKRISLPDITSPRAKRLLSIPERRTYEGLVAACQNTNLYVFTKVRLTDVLNIDRSGLSDEDFDYATKAHFDFVLTDGKHMPCLSIECHFLDKNAI